MNLLSDLCAALLDSVYTIPYLAKVSTEGATGHRSVRGRRIKPTAIIESVAQEYELSAAEIKSRKNSQQIVFPRQVAMYLCKKLTDLSYPEIGRHFNNKHHSTVMYSVEKVEKLRAEEADLDDTVERLIKYLSGPAPEYTRARR